MTSKPSEKHVSANDAKWKANQEKVAFLKQFPGLLHSWDDMVGQTVASVTPIERDAGTVLTLTNGTFAIVPPLAPEPKQLRDGVTTARARLEPLYPDAYAEYDVLAQRDERATQTARMENIVGAIHNNLERIPELQDRIRSLVKEWDS